MTKSKNKKAKQADKVRAKRKEPEAKVSRTRYLKRKRLFYKDQIL